MLKPMTNVLRLKIREKIKNRMDISDLIQDVDIRNEDLSYAIIKKFKRIDGDISNCNLAHTLLGCDTDIFTIIRTKMKNCNFQSAAFVGKAWVRSCDAQGCNFRGADISKADYQYSDFRGGTFCDAIIKIGTREGLGCVFPASMFDDLTQGWKMKITAEEIK